MLKKITVDKTVALDHSAEFLSLCNAAREQVEEVEQPYVIKALEADEHFILVDVRDAEELQAQGYIAGAYHLSKGWLEADIHRITANKEAELVLYCGSGKRSLLAALQLKKMGYLQAKSLAGGFKAWKQASLPVAQDV